MSLNRTAADAERPADDIQYLMNQHHYDERFYSITTTETQGGPEQDPDGREEIRLIGHGE
jgi:hypothetical protein